MKKELSAGAMLFRRQEGKIFYLLLQYGAGHWDFPRGLIEEGEETTETARREIKEETGIEDVNILPDFREAIKYFYKFRGETIFKRAFYFLAETKTEKVDISSEHLDFKWLCYQDALLRLTFSNSKEVLKKAHQFLEQKV